MPDDTASARLAGVLEGMTPSPWFYHGDITTPPLDVATDPYEAIGQPPSTAWPRDVAGIVALRNAGDALVALLAAVQQWTEADSTAGCDIDVLNEWSNVCNALDAVREALPPLGEERTR